MMVVTRIVLILIRRTLKSNQDDPYDLDRDGDGIACEDNDMTILNDNDDDNDF